MIKKFIIYGFIGWCIEIIWTGLYSLINLDFRLMGFTNLWMFFIYGLGVFLEPIHDRIRNKNIVIRCVIWVLLIWGIEYITGALFKSIMGFYSWYYTDGLNINGLIRIDYAPAWMVAGLIFERVHDALDRITGRINKM